LTTVDSLRGAYRAQYFLVGPGAQTHSPTLGYERKLARWLRAEAFAGPLVFIDGTPGSSNLTTWRARATLIGDSPRWRIMAGFDRDFVGGTGAAGIILVNYAFGSIRYRPLRWLDLSVRGDYFRNAATPSERLLVDGFDAGGEVLVRMGSYLEA